MSLLKRKRKALIMRKFIILLPLFLFGCAVKNSPEFLQVVKEHRELSVETCDALVLSIDEHNETGISEDAKTANNALKERLLSIKRQSILIEKYIFSKTSTQHLSELLAEIGDSK